MNKISKRLELIASFIPDNSKVIDIGCDHGLLDIYLYQNKKNISIIASDINEQALNNAKTYSDNGDASTLDSAKEYADGLITWVKW